MRNEAEGANLWVSSGGTGCIPVLEVQGAPYAAWRSTHAKMLGSSHTRRIQLIKSSHDVAKE